MATHNLSLEDFLISDHRTAEIPGAWKYRLILPMLYAMVGIALGTLTGITVAIVNPSVGNAWLPAVSASDYLADSGSQAARGTASAPAQQLAKPAATAHTASTSSPVASAQPLAAPKAAAEAPSANRQARVLRVSASHPALGKAHAEVRSRRARAVFAVAHRASLAGGHRVRSARFVLAHTTSAAPPQMMVAVEQLSFRNQALPSDNQVVPSAVYVEGDFTVASYDANHGTIETNDGRTFAVGMTVVAGNANTWNDSGSNVHYRCSQTGSCTLSGSGIFAPNARLI